MLNMLKKRLGLLFLSAMLSSVTPIVAAFGDTLVDSGKYRLDASLALLDKLLMELSQFLGLTEDSDQQNIPENPAGEKGREFDENTFDKFDSGSSDQNMAELEVILIDLEHTAEPYRSHAQ